MSETPGVSLLRTDTGSAHAAGIDVDLNEMNRFEEEGS